MTFESLHVRTDDDTQLATYRWRAPSEPRAIVIIVHGMAEHARRYDAFATHLAAAGFDVHGFDLRGHGRTTRSVDHGYIRACATWRTLIEDVARVRDHALDVIGQQSVFLFGHSLGSFIAQAVLQQHGHGYAGAILSATDKPSRVTCRLAGCVAGLEASRVGATGTSALLQRMTLGTYDRRLKCRLRMPVRRNAWITGDDRALNAYEADPDCGFAMRTRTWQRVLAGIARTNSPHARRAIPAALPLLLVAGCEDSMGRFGRGPSELARALSNDGQQDITLRLYAGARHELLHEHVADTVTSDITAWLDRRAESARTHDPIAL